MERKDLKVNVGKTKALSMPLKLTIAAPDPCSFFSKGVGANSIKCTICKKWVHRRFSRLREMLVIFTDIFSAQHAQAVTILSFALETTFGNSSRSASSPILAIA